jgi:PQQ-dependent catabolism-associated CXXCW motif protein
MLLWQRACERAGDAPPLLTLADYESLGGVGTVGSEGDASREAQNRTSNGALSDHADRVLAELTSEQQRLAAILFRALTESEGASDRAVRRPVSLANAAEIADVPISDLIPVIEAFRFRAPGRNFLTPLAPESLKPETIIDISHESLIRQWVKLRQWVQEEYQSAETYRGIERSAKQWRNGLGNLLTSLDLAQALNWHKTERPNATWAGRYGGSFGNVTGFLHASERHRLWRRGLAAAAIGVPLVLVAGALWMMFYGITMVLATLAFMNPARENADFGIQPQRILKQENIGSQTPKTIPGGQVINTLALRAALAGGTIGGSPFVLIDAWDFNHETIPKAERIPFAGSKGNFQDDTQHQLEDKLKTLTGNKPDTPLVFFCQGVECWESYNACLRAISLGYSQVYWYRGGLASWMAADETFAKEAASELANFDLSKIQIKMTTVFSNIPTIALVVKRMFVQTGQESQRVQASQPDYYSRSIADADRGNYDEAIVDLNRAIAHTPTNAEAYYRRGRAFAMKGDYNDAMPDFLKAVELDPAKNAEVQTILLDQKYAGAYCQRASNYHDRGDFDRAISDYDQAIRLDPKYAPAYGGRGKSYYNKRDYVHAFADFDAAIGIDSKNVEAYEIRAAAYSDKGDYDRAISDYDQAIRLDPKNVPTYINRGNAYFNKRDYARAITDYDQAIQLDPNNVPAYINRANAYSNKRDYAHAFIDYDQAIQLDPKNANAYNERCWARVIAGQELERALSDCNESLRIQPNDANTLDSRGSAYLKLHRLDEAIADFNAALAIEPKFASSLYGRGLAKLKNGDRVSADADMAAAKAIQADIAEKKARDNIE